MIAVLGAFKVKKNLILGHFFKILWKVTTGKFLKNARPENEVFFELEKLLVPQTDRSKTIVD